MFHLIIKPIPLPLVFDKCVKLQTLLIMWEPLFSCPHFLWIWNFRLIIIFDADESESSVNLVGACLPGEYLCWKQVKNPVCSLLQDPAGRTGGPDFSSVLLQCPLSGSSLCVFPGAAGPRQPPAPRGCESRKDDFQSQDEERGLSSQPDQRLFG